MVYKLFKFFMLIVRKAGIPLNIIAFISAIEDKRIMGLASKLLVSVVYGFDGIKKKAVFLD